MTTYKRRLSRKIIRNILASIIYVFSTYSAFALGYPIPDVKPCKNYWNSKVWTEIVRKDPNTVAYFASPHEVIGKSKAGGGILVTHDKKGCLVVRQLHPLQVEKLLTRQGDA